MMVKMFLQKVAVLVTRQQRHTMFWNKTKIWYDVDNKIPLTYIYLNDYNDLMFSS